MNGFIGRETLVQTITTWATGELGPALCLLGLGGVGKTRLAREAGRALLADFDLVWLVSMEALKPETATPGQVAREIALSLEAGPEVVEHADDLDVLVPFLQTWGKRVLLILDNFESADTLDTQQWVGTLAAAGGRCLVTSRKRFTVPGVARHEEVTRLVVPTDPTQDFDALDAVQLFRKRYEESGATPALLPYAALTPEKRSAVVEILRVTDGFPLAIEIVAANLLYEDRSWGEVAKVLGVKWLAYQEELGVRGGGPERHESMGACFQWSLELLPEEQRTKFPTLGVFPYDFSVEAAEEICGVTKKELDLWWQRSLVQREAGEQGPRRFLLSLLREYSWDRCPAEVREETETRFVNYYAALVESCWQGEFLMTSNDEVRVTLDTELRTVFAGQSLALQRGNLYSFITLNSIADYLSLRGLWAECVAMLERERDVIVLLRITAEASGNMRSFLLLSAQEGATLNNLGNAYRQIGSIDDAIECFEKSLIIRRSLCDRTGEGSTLNNLGNTYGDMGRFDDAIKCFEECLVIFRFLNNDYGESRALGNLGNVHLQLSNRGDEEHLFFAAEYFEKSIVIAKACDDFHGEAKTLINLGNAYHQQGKLQKAYEMHMQAALRMEEIGDAVEFGRALVGCGLDLAAGDLLKAAQEPLTEAVKVLETTQDQAMLEKARGVLAQVEAMMKSEE